MTELREHPDFEQLLQFLDRGMPSRSSRKVEKHIAECWKCHAQIYEIQSTIREFSRYHEKVLLPNLPAPPAPWKDLRAAMARIDEADPEPCGCFRS
jgi:anti-sigma factor RsiW